jgi:hypothetical protein
MILSRQKSVRRLAVLGLFAILAVAAYGFAAVNTVEDSYAGDGVGNIEGFNVTNVDYSLGVDPSTLDQVEFDLSPNPGTQGEAHVWFYEGDGTTLLDEGSCNIDINGHATCGSLSVLIVDAEFLRVVAVD